MPYTTILCATDGFEHSDRALRHAGDVAADSGAELHVVHVADPPLSAGILGGEYIHLTPFERRQRIERQMAEIGQSGHVQVTPHLLPDGPGSVAAQIAWLADELQADVIVVGTRARGALSGAVMGSVAQRLPHVTTRPILVVAGEQTGARMGLRRRRVPPAIRITARNGKH
jgi:nucleotide-binding universal stress UspA family protein